METLIEPLLTFLKNLSGVPSLFILFIGVLLLVVSSSDKLPITGMELSNMGRLSLFIVAFFLIAMSSWIFIIEKIASINYGKNEKQIKEMGESNEELKHKYEELYRVVNEASKLINNKPERDETDQEIIKLLNTKIIVNIQELISDENYDTASTWVKSRKKDWIKNLDLSGYSKLGLTDKKHEKEFKETMDNLLDLLAKNIINQGFRKPSLEGLSDNIKRCTPAYQQAMKDIKKQMDTDIQDNKQAFNIEVIGIIRDFMAFSIEFLDS